MARFVYIRLISGNDLAPGILQRTMRKRIVHAFDSTHQYCYHLFYVEVDLFRGEGPVALGTAGIGN